MWLWFDLDGTIANLYEVSGWLEDLRNFKTRPYEEATCLYSKKDLRDILLKCKDCGYSIGVISWSSKESNNDFDNRITKAKNKWLKKNRLDVFDEVIVTPYGERKADTCRQYGEGILIDDEENNRNDWDLGGTINATLDITIELQKLLDN